MPHDLCPWSIAFNSPGRNRVNTVTSRSKPDQDMPSQKTTCAGNEYSGCHGLYRVLRLAVAVLMRYAFIKWLSRNERSDGVLPNAESPTAWSSRNSGSG